MGASEDRVILAAAFPSDVQNIAWLRSYDSAFDVLCSDYTELAKILAGDTSTNDFSDVLESLTGLRQDIRTALQKRSARKT